MALVIKGRTPCGICGEPLEEPIIGFPAFLGRDHELSGFSDAAFHERCFISHPRAADVTALYARFQAIWASRPLGLKTVAEIEAWGREAFKKFP